MGHIIEKNYRDPNIGYRSLRSGGYIVPDHTGDPISKKQ